MKKVFSILGGAILLSSLFSCGMIIHDRLITGKIVRDCSGTYIQFPEKGDYLVCNEALLKDKADNSTVTVVYDFVEECKAKDGTIMCLLHHEKKGIIMIKSIE